MFIIRPIDAIARDKKRDVIHLSFEPAAGYPRRTQMRRDSRWLAVTAWLEEHGIEFEPCADLAGEDGFVSGRYGGRLYIDLPMDMNNAQFMDFSMRLRRKEKPLGLPGVVPNVTHLHAALRNAHHDRTPYEKVMSSLRALDREIRANAEQARGRL